MENYVKNAHVIVVGNEKGGAGKTTTSMHLITSLLALGFKTASIDADTRQRSLSRYIENRELHNNTHKLGLPISDHYTLEPSQEKHKDDQMNQEQAFFEKIITSIKNSHDFIVIDTPGSHNFFSALAHSYADTIITPLNDSFVDFDLLAKVNPNNFEIERPALYSQMVWEQKLARAKRDGGNISWFVMRNRLSNLDAKNKRNVEKMINKLAKRIGFIHIPGFSERVIFRELFLQGLTLLDIMHKNSPISLSVSHVAARSELRSFLHHLQIEEISQALNLLGSKSISTLDPLNISEYACHM